MSDLGDRELLLSKSPRRVEPVGRIESAHVVYDPRTPYWRLDSRLRGNLKCPKGPLSPNATKIRCRPPGSDFPFPVDRFL